MTTEHNVVTLFGADNTGTTNTADEIQAAIDNSVVKKGDTLYFPRGTYKITNTLDFSDRGAMNSTPAKNISIRGDGPNESIILV